MDIAGWRVYDHLVVLLHIDRKYDKPFAPFKFNMHYLNEDECINLVKDELVSYDPSSRDFTSF